MSDRSKPPPARKGQRSLPTYLAGAGAVSLVLGVLAGSVVGILAGVVLAGFAGWLAIRSRASSANAIGRMSRRSRKSAGQATAWDRFVHTSKWAILWEAPVMRPGLVPAGWWRERVTALPDRHGDPSCWDRLDQRCDSWVLAMFDKVNTCRQAWYLARGDWTLGGVALVRRWRAVETWIYNRTIERRVAAVLDFIKHVAACVEIVRHGEGEYAVQLGAHGRAPVYGSPRAATIRIGGPGSGKTIDLGRILADAPGACLVTSTRTDLLYTYFPVRQQRNGQQAYVFNPYGVGNIPSMKWSPLIGCHSLTVAHARCEDMIPTNGDAGEGERWDVQARRVLAALMHAAALTGRTMTDVLEWVSNPDDHEQEINQAFAKSSSRRTVIADCRQFFGTNDRTRTSITSTIMPALSWLNSPTARAAADTQGGEDFDVADFLRLKGSIFLLGDAGGLLAPLVGAFTGYIAREARRLSRLEKSGRIDPWLSMVLDEAALVPVDLPNWTADMGGAGVGIHIAVQGMSQLRATWGDNGASTIMNNCGYVVVYGGIRDQDDLNALSLLAGQRVDEDGRLVPSLPPAQIMRLRKRQAMLISPAGMPPMLIRTPKAYKRADIRSAYRKAHKASVPIDTHYEDTLPEEVGVDAGE